MVKITDVLHFLDKRDIRYTFTGENTFSFENFCPLNAPTKKSITWIRHAETLDVGKLNAVNGLLLAAEYGSDIRGAKFPILYVPNVHRTFFRLLERFFPEWDPDRKKPGIASSAVVETDKIGEGVYIGHHTYVGPEAEIGDHVTILNNVSIHGRVSIGDHTIIESGSSIGVCGFGQYWDEDGDPHTVVHVGSVKIGSHVKIGANNGIARGCLGETVIEDYVQTDNLVHIAHNDHIKRGAVIACGTSIAGSTTVGSNVWLAPGSVLNNSISVGDHGMVGLGGVAVKDVPGRKVVFGVPAKVLGDRKPEEIHRKEW